MRCMPRCVGERLLRDAVQGKADSRLQAAELTTQPELGVQPTDTRLLDQRRNLTRHRHRRDHGVLLIAAQEGHRAPQLAHAAPADLLGGVKRLLGRGGVAAQDVPGARHLQHHRGQPVSHEVVYVARDPPALLEQRLLGELAPACLERGGKPGFTERRATDQPRERDTHDPDSHRRLPRCFDRADRDRRRHREHTKRHRRRRRLAPPGDDERHQRRLEHDRLVMAAVLDRDHRHEHRERDRRQRNLRPVRPRAERRRRDRHQQQLTGRGGIDERRHDRHRDGDDRDDPAHLV
jgi:hypothetical protein